ncbi:MAG TPA: 50S ribosomal protein L4 [Verrucomicrobiota bacterium]|nr:50S ribosomal protein L4 [Verrucomicrobiota bacterium]HNU50252.1 50S ribosomal protein L4 [Verrucomicrobiota bacterium]
MKLPVKNHQGNPAGEHEVAFDVIESGRGTQAVHDAVVAHLANRRRGTACTKTMGEVAGSGRKPWRQKGTGRARAGSFQSPLWPGGGVVFGPKPRDFGKKISASTKALALRKALSERLKAGDVVLVDELPLAAPKTRELAGVLAALKAAGSTLLVGTGQDQNLRLAARNLAGVELTTAAQVNTYQILRHQTLVFTRPAFVQVEQRLK